MNKNKLKYRRRLDIGDAVEEELIYTIGKLLQITKAFMTP